MGTVVSLTVPVPHGSDEAGTAGHRLDTAVSVVEDQFGALEAQFSLFVPASEASRIVRGELSLTQASPLMQEMYNDAVGWRHRTDGAFTPERPDGALDLSGLVKGYAIAEAGRSLAASGLHDWCLNAGGDVLVSGSPAASGSSAPAWLAGIVDPADRRTLVGAYPLGGAAAHRLALATSGSAERGDHIWTVGMRGGPGRAGGAARPEFVQVSVAAEDIVTADVLATAIVAGGRATLDAVTSRWDVEVLAMAHDGALLATPGFRAPSAVQLPCAAMRP
ncbi:FAD:protein FMN transferase [Sinomonas notoginsengisoli]|uniref:FAD:protein FMN transferase n=1 Tax=Sinomonas notoginsengisoli TaxID=1457311 RepID=UPI001F3B5A61|nr:FAD:protein FMN transferase [Sinomonas notoginsengisoli]